MSEAKLVFFDTETTGIPKNYKAPVSDLKNWPRLVQIAWLVTDSGGTELESFETMVKPQGFKIPPDAARVHGITTEMALEQGVALEGVLETFSAVLDASSLLIAHNVQFDEKIVGAEFLRSGRPNIMATKKRFCTMHSSTDFCRLPGPYGFKWPTLQQLHAKLFRESFEGAHRALTDVRACARCYFELRRLKLIK